MVQENCTDGETEEGRMGEGAKYSTVFNVSIIAA